MKTLKYFKLLFSIVIALLGSVCAQARPTHRHYYFYEIEFNGKKSYLLGTIHLGVELSGFPKYVADKLEHSTRLYSEIKPDEKYLRDVLTNHTAWLASNLRERNKLNSSFISPLDAEEKANLLANSIPAEVVAELRCQDWNYYLLQSKDSFPKIVSLDFQIIETAYRLGISVTALDYSGVRETSDRLKTPEKKETNCELKEKLDSFNLRDLAVAADKSRQQYLKGGVTPSINDSISYRTSVWAKTLSQELKEKDGAFIAVGVVHLLGKNGLIELLKAEGFKVRLYSSD